MKKKTYQKRLINTNYSKIRFNQFKTKKLKKKKKRNKKKSQGNKNNYILVFYKNNNNVQHTV